MVGSIKKSEVLARAWSPLDVHATMLGCCNCTAKDDNGLVAKGEPLASCGYGHGPHYWCALCTACAKKFGVLW